MLNDIVQKNTHAIKHHYRKCLGFFREFHVLEMKSGHLYVQTVDLDEMEDVTTLELFYCQHRTSPCMTLISRKRLGTDHDPMRSYLRDQALPLRSKVRLN